MFAIYYAIISQSVIYGVKDYYTPYVTFVNKINAIFYYSGIMGFAENLRTELDFQNIQLKELANKTGISKNTLDKYLSGKKAQPGVENAVKIASALGVTVEYLALGYADERKESVRLLQEDRKILLQYKKLNAFNRKTIDDLMASLAARQ